MEDRERSEKEAAEMADLLGKSASLPVWLNPDKFLAPDFDDEACVADLRRYVSSLGIHCANCVCVMTRDSICEVFPVSKQLNFLLNTGALGYTANRAAKLPGYSENEGEASL